MVLITYIWHKSRWSDDYITLIHLWKYACIVQWDHGKGGRSKCCNQQKLFKFEPAVWEGFPNHVIQGRVNCWWWGGMRPDPDVLIFIQTGWTPHGYVNTLTSSKGSYICMGRHKTLKCSYIWATHTFNKVGTAKIRVWLDVHLSVVQLSKHEQPWITPWPLGLFLAQEGFPHPRTSEC